MSRLKVLPKLSDLRVAGTYEVVTFALSSDI